MRKPLTAGAAPDGAAVNNSAEHSEASNRVKHGAIALRAGALSGCDRIERHVMSYLPHRLGGWHGAK